MSKKRKSDTSTDVIRFDEYMEKGIPESLLEGLGLDVDEEANKQSDEDIDQKLEEVNESTKDENCQIITEKISSYKGSISVEDYPLVSKNNSSDLNINKIDTISSINNNHSGKSKESLKYNNFPKRSSLGSNVNSNNQQNFIINDPVAKILASQIESIAGNVTEMEKQKLLRKCINYANDKSVNLEPVCQSIKLMDNNNNEKIKEKFNLNLSKLIEAKCGNKSFLTKEKYTQLIDYIFELKFKTTGKSPADYQRLKRYDVITIGDCNKLIYPIKEYNQAIKYYVYIDEIFHIIHNTHISIDHGGRNRMMYELQKKYKNITVESVMVYLSLCESCKKKTMSQRSANRLSKQYTNLIKKNETNESNLSACNIKNESLNQFNIPIVELNPNNNFPIENKNNQFIEKPIKSSSNLSYFDKFMDMKFNYQSDFNNQQSININDPVAKIISTQIGSITGNNTDVEMQKFLQYYVNHTNAKSIKLEPIYESVSYTDFNEKMKEIFNENLKKLIETKWRNKCFITKEKYIQLTKYIFELKLKTTRKTPTDYQKLKRYDVIKLGDCIKLISPVTEDNQPVKYYVYIDEIFHIIHATHLALGHGGRNRIRNELHKKYKNITAESVMVYLNLCELCHKKSQFSKKDITK